MRKIIYKCFDNTKYRSLPNLGEVGGQNHVKSAIKMVRVVHKIFLKKLYHGSPFWLQFRSGKAHQIKKLYKTTKITDFIC